MIIKRDIVPRKRYVLLLLLLTTNIFGVTLSLFDFRGRALEDYPCYKPNPCVRGFWNNKTSTCLYLNIANGHACHSDFCSFVARENGEKEEGRSPSGEGRTPSETDRGTCMIQESYYGHDETICMCDSGDFMYGIGDDVILFVDSKETEALRLKYMKEMSL